EREPSAARPAPFLRRPHPLSASTATIPHRPHNGTRQKRQQPRDFLTPAAAAVSRSEKDYAPLEVMMSRISRSVCVMPSRPIFVRFSMDLSTSSSMMPSAAVTHLCSMASMAESTDVEMPLATLSAQLGFAPSQIIPARLAIMFFTAYDTSS